MPKVGKKHFPYTEAGYAAAAKAKKIRGYKKGGPVVKPGTGKGKSRGGGAALRGTKFKGIY